MCLSHKSAPWCPLGYPRLLPVYIFPLGRWPSCDVFELAILSKSSILLALRVALYFRVGHPPLNDYFPLGRSPSWDVFELVILSNRQSSWSSRVALHLGLVTHPWLFSSWQINKLGHFKLVILLKRQSSWLPKWNI